MGQAALDFADRALEAAGVGGWELDIATGRLTWTRLTFLIHELDEDEHPSVETAIGFYAPEARPVIEGAVRHSMLTGAPWDLELPLITARGRPIWVRACGRAVHEGERPVRLTGAIQDVTERRALSKQAERLSLVARQMTNSVIISDARGRVEWVNDAFTRLTGYGLDDIRGRTPGRLLQGPETEAAVSRRMREHIARGEGFEAEILNYTRARVPYWIAITCTALRDDSGRLTGFIAVQSDVTTRRAAEAAVRTEAGERQRAEALLRDVLEALPSGVAAYDPRERLVLANPAFAEMFPVLAAYARPGCPLEDLVRYGAQHGQYPEAGVTEAEREDWARAYIAAHRAPGMPRTIRLADGRFVQARERRSETGNLVCVRTDTTELVRAEAELRIQAERDPLTLLANRYAFLRGLQGCLDRAGDDFAPGGALLVFDVDWFKQVNDTLGHDVGDALLIEVADRLRARARVGDLPARLGGDEFAVVMPGLTDPHAVADRMSEIQTALAAPVEIGGRTLSVTISAGVSLFPQDGGDADRLFKHADLALYEAKRTGRARWCAFRPEQAEALAHHVRLADALRRALADGAIVVAFQPKRLMRGGHAGFETLARWHDGTRWVPPSEFVPVAEGSGLAVELGRTVMEAALERVCRLADLGLDPGRVAVNVAARQLLDPTFVADTMAALRRHGLGPGDLELEVTETVLIGRAAAQVEAVLRHLRSLGIALALDDFGTGFASLAHLTRLPIDRLKIDRSFVAEIGLGGRGGVIARTVIGLARSLGMESVAEGVETREQLAFLEAEGCDAAQGYLISRPILSLDEAATYLRSQGRGTVRRALHVVRAASV